MGKKTIGRVIFKDGHTEDIIYFKEVTRDELIEIWTKHHDIYVYSKVYEIDEPSNIIIPRHHFYKKRFNKYEQPDYILVNDIEKFEIFNT